MEIAGLTKNQLVMQLIRIGHGDLSVYSDLGLAAVKQEPEMFGHLIAWNDKKGEVRDSKVALPVIAFRGEPDIELYENAAAHLCKLDPRNLMRACKYHRNLPSCDGGARWLKAAITMYVREREKSSRWWDRTALQHRDSFKGLYALNHVKPNPRAQRILFDRNYPQGSVFAKLKQLKHMKADEAAGFILGNKIPFLIAVGALGGIKGKPDVILALIEQMSGNELIANTGMLQKVGAFDNPALKASYDKAVERMKKDKRVSTLKAGRAAKTTKDERAAKKLDQIQEQRLTALGGIDGDWLILGDRSGSMQLSIDVARQVASLIAQQVKGKVYLVFFNTMPTYFDVTGKTLEEIEHMSRRLSAQGGTSIGCGLELIMEKNLLVQGIAICSDGGDNTHPYFHDVYQRYLKEMANEPTVYHYWVPGDPNHLARFCSDANIMLESFDVSKDVDYYSLPQIVKTMRVGRYSLIEEIMEVPLIGFKDVFERREAI